MQQRIRRGAALASRLDLLSFIDKRGRCRALFFAVLNGTTISDPEPVIFHATQTTLPTDETHPESSAGRIIAARISFAARAECAAARFPHA